MNLRIVILAGLLGCAPPSSSLQADAAPPIGFVPSPSTPTPTAAVSAASATAPPAALASASPVQRVCADATCGGPGALVQAWRDASGAVARWEIVSSARCPHLAGLFYDREGQTPMLLPLPFYPPGKPSEERAVRSMHDAEVRGLVAGERVECAR